MFSSSELDEISGAELNNKIVSLPELNCIKCKSFLYPPILILPNLGNVCGFCHSMKDTDDNFKDTRNLSLEAILRHLVVPCRFANRGCKNQLDYFDTHEHHQICKYRKYICPMKVFGDCNWEGNLGDFLDHYLGEHPDLAKRAVFNCFRIDVDTSITRNVLKLLYTGIDKFILRIKCDEENLLFVLYYIGRKQKVSALSYSIEHKDLGIIDTSKDCITTVLHDTELKTNFAEHHALVIPMKTAKQFIDDFMLSFTVKIQKKEENVQQLHRKVLPYFECPVCSNYMKPPIFQCLAGHSICNACKPKLKHCPTCRGCFGDVRNYSFEALSNDMHFPCSHHNEGCSTVLPVKDITRHEVECYLQPYSCPFTECGWHGIYSAIIGHLQDQHKDRITFSNYKAKLSRFSVNSQYCLIAHGQIFRISRQYDATCRHIHWSIQLIGPKDHAKRYKYEIGLFDSETSHRKYLRSDICQSLSSDDGIFAQGTDVPYSVIVQYSNEGKLPYYCRIIKIDPTE